MKSFRVLDGSGGEYFFNPGAPVLPRPKLHFSFAIAKLPFQPRISLATSFFLSSIFVLVHRQRLNPALDLAAITIIISKKIKKHEKNQTPKLWRLHSTPAFIEILWMDGKIVDNHQMTWGIASATVDRSLWWKRMARSRFEAVY